jgi:hypothetical protein
MGRHPDRGKRLDTRHAYPYRQLGDRNYRWRLLYHLCRPVRRECPVRAFKPGIFTGRANRIARKQGRLTHPRQVVLRYGTVQQDKSRRSDRRAGLNFPNFFARNPQPRFPCAGRRGNLYRTLSLRGVPTSRDDVAICIDVSLLLIRYDMDNIGYANRGNERKRVK